MKDTTIIRKLVELIDDITFIDRHGVVYPGYREETDLTDKVYPILKQAKSRLKRGDK